jgi:hypothetical protein
MSENPQAEDHVVFTWGAEGDALCIQCTYGNARLHIDFVDDGREGTRELQKITATMPIILRMVRQEQLIKREADEIDGDLLALLDDGDSDE